MLNFIKKHFSLIFALLFILIFSFFNKDEFINNYREQIGSVENTQKLNTSISNFKLENIRDVKNIKFFYTPYKGLLDNIVGKINNAKTRVYVEVYMLTESHIKNALIKAHNRGVDVKVVLEKNPYKANNINNKHFDFLKKSGIDIVWSNPDLFSLNHAKFIIIDYELVVSTGNFTYSTFVYNRDLFLIFSDNSILKHFEELFLGDFFGKNILVYDDDLVVSPNYSRSKFETLFKGSKTSLDLYFQYLSDSKLEKLLIQKANSGVKIRVIVSENFYKDEKEKIKKLEKYGIKIIMLDKYTMHSKAILVDKKYLFIGSVNFSSYSLDKNRETGILLTNKDIISKFTRLFNEDFDG